MCAESLTGQWGDLGAGDGARVPDRRRRPAAGNAGRDPDARGRYLEVFEIVGIDNAAVFCKISPDGSHWPPGLGAPIALQHACPWVVSLTDGQLLVTSCSNQISTSEDYERTWSWSHPPAWDIGCALTFPAIYQTGSQEIAVMNTHGGVQIRFGTFLTRK